MNQVSLCLKVLKESISLMFDGINAHSFRPKYIQGFQVETHITNLTSFPCIVKKKKNGRDFKIIASMKRIKTQISKFLK